MANRFKYHVKPEDFQASLTKLQAEVHGDLKEETPGSGTVDHDGVQAKYSYEPSTGVLEVDIDHLPHIPFVGHKVESGLKNAFGEPFVKEG